MGIALIVSNGFRSQGTHALRLNHTHNVSNPENLLDEKPKGWILFHHIRIFSNIEPAFVMEPLAAAIAVFLSL